VPRLDALLPPRLRTHDSSDTTVGGGRDVDKVTKRPALLSPQTDGGMGSSSIARASPPCHSPPDDKTSQGGSLVKAAARVGRCQRLLGAANRWQRADGPGPDINGENDVGAARLHT
jgi:hypothetical protein